jgi:colanic acid/amylovoran biosynthesis glycosyltransferase
MTVLHYVPRWLPVSERFIGEPILRSRHRTLIVSRASLTGNLLRHAPRTHSLSALLRLAPPVAAGPCVAAAIRTLAAWYGAGVAHVHFGYHIRDIIRWKAARHIPVALSLHGHDATELVNEHPAHYTGVFDLVDVVIVPSHFLAQRARALGAHDQQVRVIPSGVDTRYFRSAPLDRDVLQVAFIGRFVEKKGLDDVLAAWPLIVASVPEARLVVLGYGPLRDLVRNVFGVTVLSPDAHDPRRQVREVLRSSRLVVTPSKTSKKGDSESLLLVNLEAQATGRPVVTTRHGGVPEFVDDGNTALLVAENDPINLARTVLRILTDDGLASRLGSNGPRWAERFDIDVTTRRLDALYDELGASAKKRHSPNNSAPRAFDNLSSQVSHDWDNS